MSFCILVGKVNNANIATMAEKLLTVLLPLRPFLVSERTAQLA